MRWVFQKVLLWSLQRCSLLPIGGRGQDKAIKTLILLCMVILLSSFCGCRSYLLMFPSNQPNCFSTTSLIGFSWQKNYLGEIQIANVIPNSPSAKAGIMPGDVLIKTNNHSIKEMYDVWNSLKSIKGKSPISVVIERKGQRMRLEVIPQIVYLPYYVEAIRDILIRGNEVNLVIIVNEVSNPAAYYASQEWKMGMRNSLRNEVETDLMRWFQGNNRFSIVDRQMTQKLLLEIELQQTGLIDKVRARAGNMTGATHLLIVDFNRTRSGFFDVMDTRVRRLIDINSGKIMSTEKCLDEHE